MNLYNKDVNLYAGVHNALGAQLAKKKGFDGVWLSGLELSASYGVPDTNILPVSKLIDACNYISYNTGMEILVDGDSGFGDFHNIIFVSKQLQKAGASGMCIEDKVFPKKNSFHNTKQKLLDINIFKQNLKAATYSKQNNDFSIVARMEGFIAGLNVEQVIERAEMCVESGVDAIVVHSKKKDIDDIESFMKYWNKKIPVIVIPTTFYKFTVNDARKMGIKGIIYANHQLRCSIAAIEKMYDRIISDGTTKNIESSIASLEEVFELQNMDLYNKQEKLLGKENE